MKYGFVVSPSDLPSLQLSLISKLDHQPILCSSPREVGSLKLADIVYFVISQTSMCSTAYQELVFAALDVIEQSRGRVLRLDDAEIPAGFNKLNSLSEGTPE